MKIEKNWLGEFWKPETEEDREILKELEGRFCKIIGGQGIGWYRHRY